MNQHVIEAILQSEKRYMNKLFSREVTVTHYTMAQEDLYRMWRRETEFQNRDSNNE